MSLTSYVVLITYGLVTGLLTYLMWRRLRDNVLLVVTAMNPGMAVAFLIGGTFGESAVYITGAALEALLVLRIVARRLRSRYRAA